MQPFQDLRPGLRLVPPAGLAASSFRFPPPNSVSFLRLLADLLSVSPEQRHDSSHESEDKDVNRSAQYTPRSIRYHHSHRLKDYRISTGLAPEIPRFSAKIYDGTSSLANEIDFDKILGAKGLRGFAPWLWVAS